MTENTTGWVALCCLALVLGSTGVPSARAQEAPPQKKVAVLPLVDRGPAAKSVASLLAGMTEVGGLHLVSGRELRKQLRRNPVGPVRRCRKRSPCLSKLAQRLRVDLIVVPSLVSQSDDAKVLELQLLSSAATEKGPTAIVDLSDPATVGPEIENALQRLLAPHLPPPTPDRLATAGSQETASTTPTPSPETSRDTNDSADGAASLPPPNPTATQTPPTESVSAESTGKPATPAQTEPVPAVTAPGRSTLLTIGGAGTALGGVVMVAVASYFRVRAKDLEDLAPRATQLEVIDQEDAQNQAAIISTVLFSVGGAAMAAGAGLVALDWWQNAPTVSIDPTGSDVQVRMGWSW